MASKYGAGQVPRTKVKGLPAYSGSAKVPSLLRGRAAVSAYELHDLDHNPSGGCCKDLRMRYALPVRFAAHEIG